MCNIVNKWDFFHRKNNKTQILIYEYNNVEDINGLFMSNTYEIYLVSDSTGETLDRIFLAIKAQFNKIEYKIIELGYFSALDNILKIWFSVLVNEQVCILYSIFLNCALIAIKILSNVSPVESEIR